MAELDVDIVAVERKIWSGKATFLFTRTTSGEIGILPNHIPLVARLVDDAMVRVERAKYPVVLTVHDEIVAERRIGEGSLDEFQRLMTTVPEWAPGLPVAAGGFEAMRYRK